MNVICAMALTSAQLDEHTNRLYVVVTFLIRILEAHDYTYVREQFSQNSFLYSLNVTPLCLHQISIPYLSTILQGRSNYTAVKGLEVISWCTIMGY